MSLKEKIKSFYESDSILSQAWALFINGLIVVSITQLLGEYNVINLSLTSTQNTQLDLAIASFFLVDYLARFYASDKRGKFIISPLNIIDLLAIIPSFVGVGEAKGLRALRILRMLRFLRIIKLIRTLGIKDVYEKKGVVDEELGLYKGIYGLNSSIQSPKNKENIESETEKIQEELDEYVSNSFSRKDKEDNRVFKIAFYDLALQAKAVLSLISKDNSDFNINKLSYLLTEMGLLLKSENTEKTIELLPTKKPSMDMQFLRLIRISFKDVITTFSIAIALNILISLTPIKNYLQPVLTSLPFIEGAMAALIVFITSFNMSYTNGKRATTDLAMIDFSNTLLLYSQRLKMLIDEKEKNISKRKEIFALLNAYFDDMGKDIINGVRKGNPYHLRFDTGVIQALDRISAITNEYLEKEDPISKNRTQELRESLVSLIGKFQTMSNIRSAIIFNALNHWVIRITYFLLTVFSPISAAPRLFVVNMMQRAFYKTANETDNAIFNISLASLPIEDRVLRRLIRINAIFS